MNKLDYLKKIYKDNLIEKIRIHRTYCYEKSCEYSFKEAVDHMFKIMYEMGSEITSNEIMKEWAKNNFKDFEGKGYKQ